MGAEQVKRRNEATGEWEPLPQSVHPDERRQEEFTEAHERALYGLEPDDPIWLFWLCRIVFYLVFFAVVGLFVAGAMWAKAALLWS